MGDESWLDSDAFEGVQKAFGYLKGGLPGLAPGESPLGTWNVPTWQSADSSSRGNFFGGAGLAANFGFSLIGLYTATDPDAEPLARVQGGLNYLGTSLSIVGGLVKAGAPVTSGSAYAAAGWLTTAGALVAMPATVLGIFAGIGQPKYEGIKQREAEGREWGTRMGFSVGVLGGDMAWATNHLLDSFRPLLADDSAVTAYKTAFRQTFAEGFQAASALSAEAKVAYGNSIFQALVADQVAVTPSADPWEALVYAVARATDEAHEAALADAEESDTTDDDAGTHLDDSAARDEPVSYPDDAEDEPVSYPDDAADDDENEPVSYPDDDEDEPEDEPVSYPDDDEDEPEDEPVSYPDDEEDEAVSYPDDGEDEAVSYPDDGEDEAVSYPDDGEDEPVTRTDERSEESDTDDAEQDDSL